MSHDRDGWPVYLVLFPLEMGSPLLTQLMDEKSFCPPLSSALGYDNADGYKLANIINISIQSTTVATIITTRLCRPRARKLDAISSYMRLLFLFSSSPPVIRVCFFSPCCSRRFGLGGGRSIVYWSCPFGWHFRKHKRTPPHVFCLYGGRRNGRVQLTVRPLLALSVSLSPFPMYGHTNNWTDDWTTADSCRIRYIVFASESFWTCCCCCCCID